MTGAFKGSESKIMFETGLSKKALQSAKGQLKQSKLVIFVDDWVVIPGTEDKNSFSSSPTSKVRYDKEFDSLPDQIKEILKNKDTLSIGYAYPTDPLISNHIISNPGKRIVKEKTKNIEELIKYFNEKFGKKYTHTEKRRRLVGDRLKSFSLTDLKRAIKNASLSPFHSGKNDQNWVANPDYIFRSDEIVDRLLNLEVREKPSRPKAENPAVNLPEISEQERQANLAMADEIRRKIGGAA
jgi:hypothetical protein